MKKLLFLAFAAFALISCSDDDTPEPFVQGDDTIAVYEDDRLVFYDYDVRWNKTRFVQNMPALDMTVPAIPIRRTAAGFEFDLPQAVPAYRGQAMPRYTLFDLEGSFDGTRLRVEFECIGYEVEYLGIPG